MKLNNIIEGRKNVAYKSAVAAGTEIVYDQSGIVIRRLTTPEAIQHWSKHSCPGWYQSDPNPEPPCTVVFGNAKAFANLGPLYYCELNQKPIYLAGPEQYGHSMPSSFLDYRINNYTEGNDTLGTLIKRLHGEREDSPLSSSH